MCANKALLDYLGKYEDNNSPNNAEEHTNSEQGDKINSEKGAKEAEQKNKKGDNAEQKIVLNIKTNKTTQDDLKSTESDNNTDEDQAMKMLNELDALINTKSADKIKEIQVPSNIDENSVDKFLRESKMIWENKKAEENKKEAQPAKKVVASKDSKVEQFLKESKCIWEDKNKENVGNTKRDKKVEEVVPDPTKSSEEVTVELDSGTSVTDLMQQAETFYPEDWLETYNKAQRSKKNNEGAQKMRAGRFRYNQDHQLEFLPDIRTDNKTVEELLQIKWI